MRTLVYLDGGDKWKFFNHTDTLPNWRIFGKERNQKYLYKGYHWFDNEREIVVVFDTKRWGDDEIARRKANGFRGIKEYSL